MHAISAFGPVSRALLVATMTAAGTFAACGGGAAPAETPADTTGEKPAAVEEDVAPADVGPTEPAVPFDQMSPGDKMQHMKNEVAPHMARIFREYAPDDFEEFGCPTCHGSGAKQGNFAMPSDSLPALDDEEMNEHPEMTEFMASKVVPQMATLLGEQPYDQATGEGFGCFDCHTKKE